MLMASILSLHTKDVMLHIQQIGKAVREQADIVLMYPAETLFSACV